MRGQPFWRRDTPTDIAYWFFTPLVTRAVTQAEGLDKNFAGLFPFIDLAFGTFYMPRGRQPERFGILGEPVPGGLIAQLTYPFKK